MNIEQIFQDAPKEDFHPTTPWGAAKTATVGNFDLHFVSLTEIEISHTRTAEQIAECRTGRKFGKLRNFGGTWCASSAAKVGGRGDQAGWAAGVQNFPTLADAVAWLSA